MGVILNFEKWNSLNESFTGKFEQAFPDYKAAGAAFAKAFAAKQTSANFAGKYHYYYTSGPNSDNTGYTVQIVGLGLRKCKDITIPDFAINNEESVTAYWDTVKGLVSPTNWPDFIKENRSFDLLPYEQKTAEELAGGINARFNASARPLATTQAMIALYPNIASYFKNISADKANPKLQAFKAKLTGNAKILFAGNV